MSAAYILLSLGRWKRSGSLSDEGSATQQYCECRPRTNSKISVPARLKAIGNWDQLGIQTFCRVASSVTTHVAAGPTRVSD